VVDRGGQARYSPEVPEVPEVPARSDGERTQPAAALGAGDGKQTQPAAALGAGDGKQTQPAAALGAGDGKQTQPAAAPGAGGAGHTSDTAAREVGSDGDVPRLPRGRGFRVSRPQLVRIAGMLILLVFLVMMQRSCSDSVSTFVTSFGGSEDRGSAAAMMPRPGTIGVPAGSAAGSAGSAAGSAAPGLDTYEHLRPGMTDDEVKAVIDRARIKAAGGSSMP
jgi:hypothetical protein